MISSTRTAQPAARDTGLQTFSTIRAPGITDEYVTCATFGCDRLAKGWAVRIDETIPIGRIRADYIRKVTNRRGWSEAKDESGTVTVFTFPPGTPCFGDARDRRAQQTFGVGPHRRQIRNAIHIVSAGGSANVAKQIAATGRTESLLRTHTRPADWAENLAESWNRMAHAINT